MSHYAEREKTLAAVHSGPRERIWAIKTVIRHAHRAALRESRTGVAYDPDAMIYRMSLLAMLPVWRLAQDNIIRDLRDDQR